VSDIDTVLVDSLKALDSKRPIREVDIDQVAVTNRDFYEYTPYPEWSPRVLPV